MHAGKIARFLESAGQTVIQIWRVMRLAGGLLLVSHLLACALAMFELKIVENIVDEGT